MSQTNSRGVIDEHSLNGVTDVDEGALSGTQLWRTRACSPPHRRIGGINICRVGKEAALAWSSGGEGGDRDVMCMGGGRRDRDRCRFQHMPLEMPKVRASRVALVG